MKISAIGSGCVGLTTARCLAEFGREGLWGDMNMDLHIQASKYPPLASSWTCPVRNAFMPIYRILR